MSVEALYPSVEFGISKMKVDTANFEFYFRGTLATLKGILDHLLEDYNDKYGLAIGPDEDLYITKFKEVANRKGLVDAVNFITNYEQKRTNLLLDPKVKLLLSRHGIRDQEIHRNRTPRHIEVNKQDKITITSHVQIKDPNGNTVGAVETQPTDVPIDPIEVRFFLQSWSNDDIPTLCEYNFTVLKAFVSRLRQAFP